MSLPPRHLFRHLSVCFPLLPHHIHSSQICCHSFVPRSPSTFAVSSASTTVSCSSSFLKSLGTYYLPSPIFSQLPPISKHHLKGLQLALISPLYCPCLAPYRTVGTTIRLYTLTFSLLCSLFLSLLLLSQLNSDPHWHLSSIHSFRDSNRF